MSIQTDPRAIREFIAELSSFQTFMSGHLPDLSSNFARLGRTWEDEQFFRFKLEVDKTSAKLVQYQESLKGIIIELEADAKAAEEIERSGGSL